MYLSGLDEIDRRMLDLLTQNARYTYSELGERLGLSRVAIKNRMDALEQRGVIEGYTVIVNPSGWAAPYPAIMKSKRAPRPCRT